jgi:hypothetical protein
MNHTYLNGEEKESWIDAHDIYIWVDNIICMEKLNEWMLLFMRWKSNGQKKRQ